MLRFLISRLKSQKKYSQQKNKNIDGNRDDADSIPRSLDKDV